MRLGFCQFDVIHSDIDANMHTIETMLEKTDAEIVGVPELALTGYYFKDEETLWDLSRAELMNPMIERLRLIAKRKDMTIIIGLSEACGESLYNTAYLIDRSGVIGKHRKMHLTDIESVFTPGKSIDVFDVKGIEIGLSICFETWFPEMFRALIEKGADLVCVPSNFGGRWTLDVIKVRALENSIPVILSNRIGKEEIEGSEEWFRGESMVVDGYGNPLLRAFDQPRVGIVEMDVSSYSRDKSLICSRMNEERKKHGFKNTTMMNSDMRSTLQRIKASDYGFADMDKKALADWMFENIGHKDPTLRDNLVYPCLSHLLYDDHFSEETLERYLRRLTGKDHLFYDIGNSLPCSVLTRSFSALQIVVLLEAHRVKKIISEDLIEETFERFLMYFEKERELSGYDDEVGWVHAVAHGADVLKQFMQLENFKHVELKRMFELIGVKMKQKNHVFRFNEDRRLAAALMKGLERDLLSETYLEDFFQSQLIVEENLSENEAARVEENARNLLSQVYALLKKTNHPLTFLVEKHLER